MYCGVDALRLLHKISDVSTDLDFEFYNKRAINHSLRVLSVRRSAYLQVANVFLRLSIAFADYNRLKSSAKIND